MSERMNGRHRAPSKVSVTSLAMGRSAKATAVAATSGGLLAAAAMPASAGPATLVEDVVSMAAGSSAGSAPVGELMAAQMPEVAAPTDRPAVATIAPDSTPAIEDGHFGTAGFVGVEPPEPEPEPVVEAPADEASADADSAAADTAAERDSTSASRTEERPAAPEPAASPAPTGGVLSVAANLTGIMYRYGGTTTSGFDCSGYTSYVYRQLGVELPRTAEGQRQATTSVSSPQPGDLVFFGAPAYHVGIYAGDGMMYDSGKPGIPTQLRSIFDGVSGYGRIG